MPQFDVALHDKPLTLRPMYFHNTINNATEHSRKTKDNLESDSNENIHDAGCTRVCVVSTLLAIFLIVIPCCFLLFITECRVSLGVFMAYMCFAVLCFVKINNASMSHIMKRGAKFGV